MDATLNFSGHAKFVQKWLDKLDAEEGIKVGESPAA
jgi:hypothetical protein